MCVLGLALSSGPSPSIPLLCLHNRDETLERPVLPITLYGPLLYSKDTRGGGTWMGLNVCTGVFAALTNVRSIEVGDVTASCASRGLLVLRLLSGDIPLTALAGAAASSSEGGETDLGSIYGGFNVVVSGLYAKETSAFVMSNRMPTASDHAIAHATGAWVRAILPGAHALSNSFFDDDRWAKVRFLRAEVPRVVGAWPALQGGESDQPTYVEPPGPIDVALSMLPELLQASGDLLQLRALPQAASGASCGGEPSESLAGFSSAMAGGLAWSPLPPAEEAHLQSHLFLDPVSLRGTLEATRATTAVMKLRLACGGEAVAYCLRSYDVEQRAAAGLPPEVGIPTPPRALVEATEEAGAFKLPADLQVTLHTVRARGGAEWLVHLCLVPAHAE